MKTLSEVNKLMVEMYRWREGIGYTHGVAFAIDQFTMQPDDDGFQWLLCTYYKKEEEQVIEITENIHVNNDIRFRIIKMEGDGRYQGLVSLDKAMEELKLNSITEIERNVAQFCCYVKVD